jgi:WD40 repeat protein
VTTGTILRELDAPGEPITALTFSGDGRLLAWARQNGLIELWDVQAGTRRRELRGHQGTVARLGLSRDGRRLVSIGRFDLEVRLWDLSTSAHRARQHGHQGIIRDIDFSPDGRLVATAGFDRSLRIWDVATGEQRQVLRSPEAQLTVRFSPEGRHLLAGEHRGTVRLWDLQAGVPAKTLGDLGSSVDAVEYSPDRR